MNSADASERAAPKNPLLRRLRAFFFCGCLGLGIGYAVWGPIFNVDPSASRHKKCATNYRFVNPEPDCETLEATIGRMRDAEQEADAIVTRALEDGKVTRTSVFSRDLTTLQYVGINERSLYSPASLLKIPLMVAYLKYAETNPDVMHTMLTYPGGDDLNSAQQLQTFESKSSLQVGQAYSVENLIKRMIKYSDNNATSLLLASIDQGFLERTFLELGIKIPREHVNTTRDFVTTVSFAAIFRTLYNSSYLSRESSEKALALLSKSTFDQGIRSILPAHTPLVEKYGERTVLDETGKLALRELHECGIVYAENRPFTFCVFTEGKNFEDMLSTLRDIEKALYKNEVSGNT